MQKKALYIAERSEQSFSPRYYYSLLSFKSPKTPVFKFLLSYFLTFITYMTLCTCVNLKTIR